MESKTHINVLSCNLKGANHIILFVWANIFFSIVYTFVALDIITKTLDSVFGGFFDFMFYSSFILSTLFGFLYLFYFANACKTLQYKEKSLILKIAISFISANFCSFFVTFLMEGSGYLFLLLMWFIFTIAMFLLTFRLGSIFSIFYEGKLGQIGSKIKTLLTNIFLFVVLSFLSLIFIENNTPLFICLLLPILICYILWLTYYGLSIYYNICSIIEFKKDAHSSDELDFEMDNCQEQPDK